MTDRDDRELERTAPYPMRPEDTAPRAGVTAPVQYESWRPREEIVSLRGGVGIIDNIRRDSGRARFTIRRPGEPPEDLWLPINHFDERLRDGDWGRIQDVGEGPPEPDWTHSELRRILPPQDEPPASAVHIEPKMLTGAVFGVMVTIHGNRGESFARFRENDSTSQWGSWHKPDAWVQDWGSDRKWSDAETQSVDFRLDPFWTCGTAPGS